MYFLLKMGIFHCYVSLPEGNLNEKLMYFKILYFICILRYTQSFSRKAS